MYLLKPFRYKQLFICLVIIFTICSSIAFSQISEGGKPPSFNDPLTLRIATSAVNVPIDFNVEDLRETAQMQARPGVPMPVAKLIPVNYSIDNAGYYTQLPSGENIWRLYLKAKDAVAIMLYYNDFYIPVGGRLFIYSADRKQLLGAYTHRTHPEGGLFATEFVGGDELILEYVTSETSEEKPRIVIGDIGYGYNMTAFREFLPVTTRASGDCQVNINCEEGQAWQNEKKSVCSTFQRIGDHSYICTGSLMNNTAVDFKPLILTAAHCACSGTTFASEQDMEQWMFYFQLEREACSNASDEKIPVTMTGCSLLANTGMAGRSDGLLLLLKNRIPENYDVYYNGWDRSGDAALSGAGIHHPQGDYKKISTYNEPAQSYTFQSFDFNGDTQAHWNVIYKVTANGHSVTEEGSSGSPLFNENKLVVGTLTGGNSSCDYPRGVNLYGKLSYHWDRYKTDSTTRMDVWLDPLNTGVKSFPGRFEKEHKPIPRNLKAVNLGNSISLSWDTPQGDDHPKEYYVYRNNSKIAGTTSLSFIDNYPLTGSITYSVSAIYNDGEESGIVSATLLLIKYKAPSDLKAERASINSNQIEISWKAPVYEQTIFWGPFQSYWEAQLGLNIPFYFGQRWTAAEIAPLHNKTIKAVQFIPVDDNAYDVYISQGERSYRQSLENTTLRPNEINTIELTSPFVIDGSKALVISIYTAVVTTDYPARCDDGPAVSGKGNLISVDGTEWVRITSVSGAEDFDYNFMLSAIVTSENDNSSVQSRNSSLLFENNPVTLRNSIPALFPEITKYRVYRNGSFFKEINPSETSCTDIYLMNPVYYQVSAFYNEFESGKSDTARISVVNNENMEASVRLFPTQFTNYITLQGYEYVSRIEAVSVSGKVWLIVNNPQQQIDASSLPPGIYFFRIYDVHNKQTVIKAIKVG